MEFKKSTNHSFISSCHLGTSDLPTEGINTLSMYMAFLCCISVNGITQLSLLINDLSEKTEIKKERRSLNWEAPNKSTVFETVF